MTESGGGTRGNLKDKRLNENKCGTQESLKEQKSGSQESVKETKKGGAQASLTENGGWQREPHSGFSLFLDPNSDKKIPNNSQKSLIITPSPSTLHHHTSPIVGPSPG